MIKVSDKTVTWQAGMTITDLLKEIDDDHPYAVVRINDRYIARPDFDRTAIPNNSEVFLIPMIAGG